MWCTTKLFKNILFSLKHVLDIVNISKQDLEVEYHRIMELQDMRLEVTLKIIIWTHTHT